MSFHNPVCLHVFFSIRKISIWKWASKTSKLKKMLGKPSSDAWAAVFKNADFS